MRACCGGDFAGVLRESRDSDRDDQSAMHTSKQASTCTADGLMYLMPFDTNVPSDRKSGNASASSVQARATFGGATGVDPKKSLTIRSIRAAAP